MDGEKEIREWLNQADETELHEFLIRKAAALEGPFYRELRRSFKPQSDQEKLSQLKDDISQTFQENLTSPVTRDQDLNRIEIFLYDIVDDAVNFVAKKNLNLAIQEILLVFGEGFELLELEDVGGDMLFDDALRRLSTLSKAGSKSLSDKQKNDIVNAAIKASETEAMAGWPEYRSAIFDNVLLLVTDNTIGKVIKSAKSFDDQYAKDYYSIYKSMANI